MTRHDQTELDDISIMTESIALAATWTLTGIITTVVVGFGLASQSPILMILCGIIGTVLMAVPIVSQIDNIVNKKMDNQ